MLSATILVLLFIPTLSSPAAAPATAGGNTAQGDQIDGCLSPTKTDPPSFLPQVSDSEHQDAPYKKYIDSDRPSIYGGLTCCAKDGESDLSDNLVSSMSAACRGLYEYCGQCAEAWERVFFAAACSPQQASFVKQTENQTYYTLYMHKDLALSLWEGCKEDDELVSDHGTHGRPLKYVYNNALDYKGVTWNTHQLKAKFYVEDLVMKHTPALYLSEATQVRFLYFFSFSLFSVFFLISVLFLVLVVCLLCIMCAHITCLIVDQLGKSPKQKIHKLYFFEHVFYERSETKNVTFILI